MSLISTFRIPSLIKSASTLFPKVAHKTVSVPVSTTWRHTGVLNNCSEVISHTRKYRSSFADDDDDDVDEFFKDSSKPAQPKFNNAVNYRDHTSNNTFIRGNTGDSRGSGYGRKPNFQPYNRYPEQNYGNRYEDRNSFSYNESSFGQGKYDNYSRQGRGSTMSRLDPVKWSEISVPEVKTAGYTPSEAILNRPISEDEEYRQKHSITIKGEDCPRPIINFSDYDFPEYVKRAFDTAEFEAPTPIQAQSWPIAFSGKDLISIGQTGSGKTLAFMLPGLAHIMEQKPLIPGESPIVLVLSPTRELANQTRSVAKTFTGHIRSICVYGGSSRNVQRDSLRSGREICIATPGRLTDFLSCGDINLHRCSYLVLDEADRMLDMGFEPQIRQIVSQMRPDRQTMMFSATWPTEVKGLARQFLKDPVQMFVGGDSLAANPDITQNFIFCEEVERMPKLKQLLQDIKEDGESKILLFVNTKRMCDNMSYTLSRMFRTDVIHGDKSQGERDRSYQNFRHGRTNVLVATEIAARGLDVSDITHVINFDFPKNCSDYVHRIGRTGRCGRNGVAHSFITSDVQRNTIMELTTLLKKANQIVPEQLGNIEQSRRNVYRF